MQTQMQKYFANALFLILSIVSQQTITLFLQKTRTIKSIKTSVIISSAVQKNLNIFDVLLNNLIKRRYIINKLRNKFVFIIQSRLSSRINFSSNFFNLMKSDMNVARTILRRKHNICIKNLNLTINHEH